MASALASDLPAPWRRLRRAQRTARPAEARGGPWWTLATPHDSAPPRVARYPPLGAAPPFVLTPHAAPLRQALRAGRAAPRLARCAARTMLGLGACLVLALIAQATAGWVARAVCDPPLGNPYPDATPVLEVWKLTSKTLVHILAASDTSPEPRGARFGR